jgi:hypothetical protein
MTQEQLEFVNKLKAKVSELNELVSEINKDKGNTIRINIYQENWNPMTNHDAVKNAVKYVACQVSETFNF